MALLPAVVWATCLFGFVFFVCYYQSRWQDRGHTPSPSLHHTDSSSQWRWPGLQSVDSDTLGQLTHAASTWTGSHLQNTRRRLWAETDRSEWKTKVKKEDGCLTHSQVGGVDTVPLGVVQHQWRWTAAVIRANRVHTGSTHTGLLLTLIMIWQWRGK